MVAILVGWYLTSGVAVVTLKLSAERLRSEGHDLADQLFYVVSYCTFCQLLSTFAVSNVVKHSYVVEVETQNSLCGTTVSSSILRTSAIWHCLGTATANWATVFVGASATQVVKLLEPVSTVCLSHILLNESISLVRIISTLLTVAGVTFLTPKDSVLNLLRLSGLQSLANSPVTNIMFVLNRGSSLVACVVAFPMSNVLMKLLDFKDSVNTASDVATGGSLALLPISLLMAFFFHPSPPALVSSCFRQSMTSEFLSMVLSNAAYRIFSVMALKRFDATYHSQLRLGKRFATVVVSFMILHDITLPLASLLTGMPLLLVGLTLPLYIRGNAAGRVAQTSNMCGLKSVDEGYCSSRLLIFSTLVFVLTVFGMHVPLQPGPQSIETLSNMDSVRAHRPLASFSPDSALISFGKTPLSVLLINYTGKRGFHFGQHGASYVMERLVLDVLGPETLVTRWWQDGGPEFDELLLKSDLVIANAEGTLHDKCELWRDMLQSILANDVRLWIINGSFSFKDTCESLMTDLQHAEFISLRDPYSLANFALHSRQVVLLPSSPSAVNTRITVPVLSADLTFLIPNNHTEEVNEIMSSRHPNWVRDGTLRVILSGSSLYGNAYPDMWKKLLPEIMKESAQVRIVLDDKARIVKELQDLAEKHNNVTVVRNGRASLSEMLWIMKNADIHIGGRFHAATYALSAGTPSLLFEGNTWKISSLVEPLRSSSAKMFDTNVLSCRAEDVWKAAKKAMVGQPKGDEANVLAQRLALNALKNMPVVEPYSLSRVVDNLELRYQEFYLKSLEVKFGETIKICEIFGCC